MNGYWTDIENNLSKTLNHPIHIKGINEVSGGCINNSYKISDDQNNSWFIKTHKPEKLDMFIAEAEGLNSLKKTASFHIPEPLCYGKNNDVSYLILAHINLHPHIKQKQTGEALAKMHLFEAHASKTKKPFGWKQDNTIGSTPQSNQPHNSWITFWKEQRLTFQFHLAKQKGYSIKDFEKGLKLSDNLAPFFSGYTPKPSLLHGDLWGGNCASDETGNPVIFDPAVYIGDRETDIAMTELFGGFNQNFYDAYNSHYPLDQGYKTRKHLYNLYHILNHYNLFGGSYAMQASSMVEQLLAEVN